MRVALEVQYQQRVMSNGCYEPSDLVRHAADALIAVDAERRILSMNPSAEALTGIGESQAIGRPCQEILQSSICGESCPFDRAFHKEEQVTTFDVRVQNRAGESIPVCVNTSVLKNDNGEKIGLVESIRDIRHVLRLMTEREAAVTKAEKLASWFEAVLEAGSDGVVTIDRDCRITSFSRSAEMLTGYKREEVVGADSREVFRSDFCPLAETLERGEGLPATELNFHLKDGGEAPVMLSTELLRDSDNTPIGAVAILRDQREVRKLREELQERRGLDRLIGRSPRMLAIYDRLERIAPTDSTVLIFGESGTGKELVAQILHSRSPRWDKPLVKVNCAALPESLLESELFGHVRGAFTGAVSDRVGRFELAHRGTIFLDEVGDLPPHLQVKLLRVLQEREFEKVGGTKTIQVDVRILAATNRDLPRLVAAGTFREDLYYRLHVVPIELPALREHPEDIPLLAESFLTQMAGRTGNRAKQLTPQSLRVLMDYQWPGNVRELENALEYGAVTSEDDWIRSSHLPPRLRKTEPAEVDTLLASAVTSTERESLLAAIRHAPTTQEAARRLGISRATLWRKMRKCGITLTTQRKGRS